MARLLTTTRLNSIKLVLGNPRLLIVGTQYFFYDKGLFGKIPIRSVFSLFKEHRQEIKLQQLASDIEGVTIAELSILCWIARNVAPETIFEFGTSDGRTTINFALNTPGNCQIHTLDLPEEERRFFYCQEQELLGKENFTVPFKENVGLCYRDHSLSSKVTQLYGDSTQFDYAPYFGKMDLIFIDANHEYKYVKSDTENALKMLSEHGTIVWHDYPYWEGVWRYLDELFMSGLPIYRIQDTRLACYTRLPY